jgi:hypothetical protein
VKTKTNKQLRYVIIRTRSAGCFAGELMSQDRDIVVLKNSRRLWFWTGAATLSQLAIEGTSRPDACKFPVMIPVHTVLGVIEIIDATPAGRASIEGVPVWSAGKGFGYGYGAGCGSGSGSGSGDGTGECL